jgi:hypothetical protein
MIHEALDTYARATARVFADRSNTVGASEIGQCARKIFFEKNEGDWLIGASRDADYVNGWGACVRGTVVEDHFFVPALRQHFGDKLKYAGADQRTLVSDFLSATPDGLITDLPRDVLAPVGVADIGGDGSLVVECKTADPRTKLDEAKPEHTYQAQVQLGLIREQTKHRPELALVSYINASFWNEITEFPVRFNPATFANAKQRAAQIMTALSPHKIKPEGWIAGGRECEYCAFNQACGRMRHAVPTQAIAEQPDPQFVTEIMDLACEVKRRRRDVEIATAALRKTEHAVRERLRDRGLRRVEGDGLSVVWSSVKGRQSYDMKGIREAAAKAGIDLAEYETTGGPTDRLVIRVTATAATQTADERNPL